jgi:hypothetical protein
MTRKLGIELVFACKFATAFDSAWRALQGVETMKMIRKRQVKGYEKMTSPGRRAFVGQLLDYGVIAPGSELRPVGRRNRTPTVLYRLIFTRS